MDDRHYMMQALALARRGAGRVEPNPMVGCLLVKDGRVVGRGYHRRFGQAHAERIALDQAGPLARGATAYLTLEPCAHFGKTPPCAPALVQAGLRRVVVALADPNPRSAGGLEQLRAAGIQVEVGLCAEQAAELIAPFAKTITRRMPYVIAKWAATIDGRTATRTGDSRWISNARSRRLVHRLRGRVDAVLVGLGTVLADDPRLTARHVRPRRIARRIVLDPHLRLPARCRLLDTLDQAPLTLAVSRAALRARPGRVRQLADRGVELLTVRPRPGRPARLDLADLLKKLYRRHTMTNLLVEGGAQTHTAFFEQNLVDELLVFIGPVLMADRRARPALQAAEPVPLIKQARRARLVTVHRLDDDVMLQYRLT